MYDEVSKITALKLNLDSVANYSSRKGFIYLNYVLTCSSTNLFCEQFLLVTERQRIDAFELWCWRRLLSPLDCKEIQPVHSEGDQPWDFFGRNDAEAETPVLWPPHAKS